MSHLIISWASYLVHVQLCFKQGGVSLSSVGAVLHWPMVCGAAIVHDAPADKAGWKRAKGPAVYHVRRGKSRVVCQDPAMPCKGMASWSGSPSCGQALLAAAGILDSTMPSPARNSRTCGQQVRQLQGSLAEVG